MNRIRPRTAGSPAPARRWVRLERLRILALAGMVGGLGAGVAVSGRTASAGAFEQLQSMAGGGSVYVPPVGDPVCVEGCDVTGGQEYENSGAQSPAPNLYDRISRWQQQRTEKRQREEQQKKQEAFGLNEQANRAYEQGDWDTSIALYQKALSRSPQDEVIQENLRRAEREKKRLEELRRERSAYRRQMGELLAVLPPARPLIQKVPPRSPVVPLPGFPPEQWTEYLAAQETVAVLYARLHKEGKLSDADAEAFYAALRRRNALWAAAAGQPRADEERDRLQLQLPRVTHKALLDSVLDQFKPEGAPASAPPPQAPDRRQSSGGNQGTPPDDPVSAAFAAGFFAGGITDILESGTGDAIGAAHGEAMKSRYEKMLAAGRIAVTGRNEGLPAAGAETADLVISLIPGPTGTHAEFAVEGGRVYSKVAYRALDRFMVDALNATGTAFDPEAFRKNFNEELTASRKGVQAWIQFGE